MSPALDLAFPIVLFIQLIVFLCTRCILFVGVWADAPLWKTACLLKLHFGMPYGMGSSHRQWYSWLDTPSGALLVSVEHRSFTGHPEILCYLGPGQNETSTSEHSLTHGVCQPK